MNIDNTVCFFRVDASETIGLGHVMRCLTLSKEFIELGIECIFLYRALPESIIKKLKRFDVTAKYLSYEGAGVVGTFSIDIEKDAAKAIEIIKVYRNSKKLLVVDHYGIDAYWEQLVIPYILKCMVIDDLANRKHQCDVLLDQTYNRQLIDYNNFVPKHAELLCGTGYALLGAEFHKVRQKAQFKRKKCKSIRNILLNFGGSDPKNLSAWCIKILNKHYEHQPYVLTIVLGAVSVSQNEVELLVQQSKIPATVIIDAENMSDLILEADLAIGAAGTSAWERCCLGLPTIMFVIAENQQKIAKELSKHQAVSLVEINDKESQFLHAFDEFSNIMFYQHQSENAFSICDGLGVKRAVEALLEI